MSGILASMDSLLGAALGGATVGGVWYFWWRSQRLNIAEEQRRAHEATREEAQRLRKEIELNGQVQALELRRDAEAALAGREREAQERERAVSVGEERVAQRELNVQEREKRAGEKQRELEDSIKSVEALKRKRMERLSAVAGITEKEAREEILASAKEESESEAINLRRRIVDTAKSSAEEQAKKILAIAIQRYSGEYTFETTTATVALLNEDIKGRIIGREGRNIRAFEKATGMTVLIDDTPNAVVISGFDPTRREIARQAMRTLIQDGRIHPTRIEEVVERVRQEMDETIMRSGEEAVLKISVPPLPSEVNRVLGNLRFRLSYSQNILDHSIEVASLCGIMAAELKLNVQHAKLAGLLHDIGKAIQQDAEGGHAIVGAEFLKRHGLPEAVINGVASHHDEVPSTSPYGPLVSAADAISASRPGARSETLTTYLKRLESLESIGNSIPGVEKCFAVHAGREVRVLVKSDEIPEDSASQMAYKIARQIEEELQYPGQIRVTVLRESRWVDVAK